jgi:hypothetical protein
MKRLIAVLVIVVASLLAQTSVTVSGAGGWGGQQTTFNLPLVWHPKLTAVATCPAVDIFSGSTMTCTVTLNSNVPGGQTATITLTSTDTTKLTVPASVTIPGGSASATFVVTAL